MAILILLSFFHTQLSYGVFCKKIESRSHQDTLLSAQAQSASGEPAGGAGPENVSNQDEESPRQLVNKKEKMDTINMIGCKRAFSYQSREWPIDSNHIQDGELLRPFIKDVPNSVSELNLYQQNRRNIQYVAFIGSVGVALLLSSLLLADTVFEPPTSLTVKEWGLRSGFGLAAGALIYSFSVTRSNEKHLKQAVENFNTVNKNNEIELQFSTGILF
jgi:hypothetical protein